MHNCPISFVAGNGGRNTISFVEYIRFLDFDIRTCLGTEPERLVARNLLDTRRHSGAVLDTYSAWTVSTMDAFDVLQSVFGTLFIPQTVIDELRDLRDEQETTAGRSMTMTWHNGQYIRQEHTVEDIAARRGYIAEQLARIEAACVVRPVLYPDHPSEIAVLINQLFGSDVFDAANLAGTDRLLVSEDMSYRQFSEGACAAKGLWLQAIFSFAHESALIDSRRYVDLVVKLAWRRHGHLALSPDLMLATLKNGAEHGLDNFKALVSFIFTPNAEMRSHTDVSTAFLNQVWHELGRSDLRCMQATSALLDRVARLRGWNWALVLAFLKSGCPVAAQQYIDGWIAGHFLPAEEVAAALRDIEDVGRRLREKGNVRAGVSASRRAASGRKRQNKSK